MPFSSPPLPGGGTGYPSCSAAVVAAVAFPFPFAFDPPAAFEPLVGEAAGPPPFPDLASC